MNYKKTYLPQKGYTPMCKIGECSLKRLEFGIIALGAGESLRYSTEDKETAFILLEGHCDVTFDNEKWENVGNRSSVFENKRAESFFMPRDMSLDITARDNLKIAVCATPVAEKGEPQLLREERVPVKLLGRVPFQRETTFLIDGMCVCSKISMCPRRQYPLPHFTGRQKHLQPTGSAVSERQ